MWPCNLSFTIRAFTYHSHSLLLSSRPSTLCLPPDVSRSYCTLLMSYSWITPVVGPGDHRPTAQHIIEAEGLVGKLSDKVILITGASAGFGVETARALYHTGAHLFLPVRDKIRGERVKRDIESDGLEGSGKIELLTLDLNSLDSVRQCAADFSSKSKQLHVLICNAGVASILQGQTQDGFETHFGVNHLAHFLLFQLLKETLLSSSTPDFNSRVVMVASGSHKTSTVMLDDLDFSKRGYNPQIAYAQSKTANVHMALELERRFGSRGLHSTSVHPGEARTELLRQLPLEAQKQLEQQWNLDRLYKSTQQGAATTVWAAVGKEWEGKGGKYLEDCMVAEQEDNVPLGHRGYGTHAYDEVQAKRLWEASLRMVDASDE